jgi:hypothetical protein
MGIITNPNGLVNNDGDMGISSGNQMWLAGKKTYMKVYSWEDHLFNKHLIVGGYE